MQCSVQIFFAKQLKSRLCLSKIYWLSIAACILIVTVSTVFFLLSLYWYNVFAMQFFHISLWDRHCSMTHSIMFDLHETFYVKNNNEKPHHITRKRKFPCLFVLFEELCLTTNFIETKLHNKLHRRDWKWFEMRFMHPTRSGKKRKNLISVASIWPIA